MSCVSRDSLVWTLYSCFSGSPLQHRWAGDVVETDIIVAPEEPGAEVAARIKTINNRCRPIPKVSEEGAEDGLEFVLYDYQFWFYFILFKIEQYFVDGQIIENTTLAESQA